jgi:hypothetical protein
MGELDKCADGVGFEMLGWFIDRLINVDEGDEVHDTVQVPSGQLERSVQCVVMACILGM